MRDGDSKNNKKLSWSKSLLRRWFNIKRKAQDFHSDYDVGRGRDEELGSLSLREACTVRKNKAEKLLKESTDKADTRRLVPDATKGTKTLEYRSFVSTWNVGGKSPPSNLNLEDWLHASPLADVYVLGFQEIVPLSAGNILGTEDRGPAKKWVSIIRKALNSLLNEGNQTPPLVCNPGLKKNDGLACSSSRQWNSSYFRRHSFQSLNLSTRTNGDIMVPQTTLDRRYCACDQVIFGSRPSDCCPSYRLDGFSNDDNVSRDSPGAIIFSPLLHDYGESSLGQRDGSTGCSSRYCLLASKQMVGIFLSIWVKGEIRDDIRNLKVSCVGRGLMGYLDIARACEVLLIAKYEGSIAISMSLHQTSFCFICSHLTSGQEEGNGLRRNSDVMEILRKTRFPPVHRYDKSPETILEHDQIIWLGDLNYRISLSYRSTKALVEMRKLGCIAGERTAPDGAKMWPHLRGLERRKNTFSSNI